MLLRQQRSCTIGPPSCAALIFCTACIQKTIIMSAFEPRSQAHETIAQIVQLSKGTSNEEKIAAIVLALKFADEQRPQNDASQNRDDVATIVLTQTIHNVTANFVKSMMISSDPVSEIAVQLLSKTTGIRDVMLEFTESLPLLLDRIVETICVNLSSSDRSAPMMHDRLVSIIQAISFSGGKQSCQDTIVMLLQRLRRRQLKRPVEVLQMLTMLLRGISGYDGATSDGASTGTRATCSLTLPGDEAETLRSLVVQGLHGGAPESIRHETLVCLTHLFTQSDSDTTSCLFINPSWTVEANTGSDPQPERGRFVTLLCRILRGELHMMLEEALCLWGVQSPEESDTSNKSGSKAESSSKNIESRDIIVRKMLDVLFQMLDSIFEYLVESLSDLEDSEDIADLVGRSTGDRQTVAWSQLSIDSLLNIRDAVYACIHEMLDFVKSSAEMLVAPEGKIKQPLQITVAKCAMTVSRFVTEDASLYEPMVLYAKHFVAWSEYARHGMCGTKSNTHECPNDASEDFPWNNLVSSITAAEVSLHMLPVPTDELSVDVSKGPDFGARVGMHDYATNDALVYMLPAFLTVVCQIEDSDEDMTEMITRLTEELGSTTGLFVALSNLVCMILSKLNDVHLSSWLEESQDVCGLSSSGKKTRTSGSAENKTASNLPQESQGDAKASTLTPMQADRVLTILSMAVDFLYYIITHYQRAIHTLVPAEGLAAVQAVLGVEVKSEVVERLIASVAVRASANQKKDRLSELNKEATVAINKLDKKFTRLFRQCK